MVEEPHKFESVTIAQAGRLMQALVALLAPSAC